MLVFLSVKGFDHQAALFSFFLFFSIVCLGCLYILSCWVQRLMYFIACEFMLCEFVLWIYCPLLSWWYLVTFYSRIVDGLFFSDATSSFFVDFISLWMLLAFLMRLFCLFMIWWYWWWCDDFIKSPGWYSFPKDDVSNNVYTSFPPSFLSVVG